MAEIQERHTPDFKKNAVLMSYERKDVHNTAKELEIAPKLLKRLQRIAEKLLKNNIKKPLTAFLKSPTKSKSTL